MAKKKKRVKAKNSEDLLEQMLDMPTNTTIHHWVNLNEGACWSDMHKFPICDLPDVISANLGIDKSELFIVDDAITYTTRKYTIDQMASKIRSWLRIKIQHEDHLKKQKDKNDGED